MLVLKEQTTFEPYVPERYSKVTKYKKYSHLFYTLPNKSLQDLKRICKNCHEPLGNHRTYHNTPNDMYCPTTYILQ